ncbi:V-type proton ATPase subunit C [Pelomyxa schiedti]|nr:V-type proton ATPase subunit C [Pelomyxa schiedti]
MSSTSNATSSPASAATSSAAAPPRSVGRQLFILSSVPKGVEGAISQVPQVQTGLRDLATCFQFDVPPLNVGTQDTLMLLSDELQRLETFAETATRRIAQQYEELRISQQADAKGDGKPDAKADVKPVALPVDLLIRGQTPEAYLTQFQWEDAKYSPKAPLKETTARISQHISRLDEELRTKTTSYNNIARDIAAEQRKEGTSLVTKNLSEIVTPQRFVESENLTTLIVAVPKVAYKDWFASYEGLTEFVVPGSSELLAEDSEYGLYTVILFKRSTEDFKNLARERRFTVRDFSRDQLSDTYKQSRTKKLEELTNQKKALMRWCIVNFAESFIAWVHLKVIRTFVESVLRYGLPPNFLTVICKPKRDEKKTLTAMARMFEYLGDSKMLAKDKDDTPEAREEFLPFVYSVFDCDFGKMA